MKSKQHLFNLFVVLALITVVIFMYETKYDEVDIDPAIKAAVLTLKPNQEIIIFDSKNPFNFHDILNNIDKVSNQEVYGVLTYPEDKKKQWFLPDYTIIPDVGYSPKNPCYWYQG